MKTKNLKIFGFNIYQRVSRQVPIEVDSPPLPFNEYQGIIFTHQIKELRFHSNTYLENQTWNQSAIDAIVFSIHVLFKSRLIEIFQNIEFNYFLGRTFCWKKYGYELLAKQESTCDLLTNKILDAIPKTTMNNQPRTLLTSFVQQYMGQELGLEEIRYPEMDFIERVLTNYAANHTWIASSQKSKALGLYSILDITIDQEVKSQIAKSYISTNRDLIKTINRNESYSKFIKALEKLLKREFDKRLPKPVD